MAGTICSTSVVGPGHTHNEHGRLVCAHSPACKANQSGAGRDEPVHPSRQPVPVERRQPLFDRVGRVEIADRRRVVAQIVERLAEGETQPDPRGIAQRSGIEQRGHARDRRAIRLGHPPGERA
jgi:hypothetical protein